MKKNEMTHTMSMKEIIDTNGGLIPVGTALSIAGAVIYVYNNWDDFCEGVKRGWNNTVN